MFDKDAARRAVLASNPKYVTPSDLHTLSDQSLRSLSKQGIKKLLREQRKYHQLVQAEVADRARKNAAHAQRMERVALIEEMRQQGMNYKRIGEVLGISRERVRQIANQYVRPELQFHRKPGIHITRQCALLGCHATFTVYTNGSNKNKKYCSRPHRDDARRKYATPEEARTAMNARQRERYKLPEVKAAHKKAVLAYYHRIKDTDAYKAKNREYHKRWLERMKRDEPIRYARRKARLALKARENLQRLKEDPARYAAYKERYLEHNRRKAEKKKEEKRLERERIAVALKAHGFPVRE